MPGMQIEFTNETLVMTDQGVQKLIDLLERPVSNSLWGVKWKFNDKPNGISFHKSHKRAKEFAKVQLDSEPEGPARLVNVSDHIYTYVQENGYCWTKLNRFEEAQTFVGEVWNH